MHSKIVGLFVEDFAQEQFLQGMCRKVATQVHAEVEFRTFVSRGGRGAVLGELRAFFRLQQNVELHADYIVVGNDGNCQGYVKRRNEVFALVPEIWKTRVALAIPDPHIEAWFFRDLSAFHRSVGPCNAPPIRKCDKGFYKNFLLEQTIAATGYATLGGIENAAVITNIQDLGRLSASGVDLKNFITELQMLNSDITRPSSAPR